MSQHLPGNHKHQPSTDHAHDIEKPYSKKTELPVRAKKPPLLRDRIKAARQKDGNLSQREAAEKWGINLRTLQSWETTSGREPRGLARKALETILTKIERRP